MALGVQTQVRQQDGQDEAWHDDGEGGGKDEAEDDEDGDGGGGGGDDGDADAGGGGDNDGCRRFVGCLMVLMQFRR